MYSLKISIPSSAQFVMTSWADLFIEIYLYWSEYQCRSITHWVCFISIQIL